MKKQYIGFTDFNKEPIETVIVKGSLEQALIFRKIIFGKRAVSDSNYGAENPNIIPILNLDDFRIVCTSFGGEVTFECSHLNEFLFRGHQDEATKELVIMEDTARSITEKRLTVKDMCLFPSFKHYAVCDACQNSGFYMVEVEKTVACTCPNKIFEYE